MSIKYITIIFKYIFFILFLATFSFTAQTDTSIEEIIKGRKALFSKNYSTAKKVQNFASKGDFEKTKSLMIEMSENYKELLEYFPENTKEGFKTEALPSIWENKDEFNALMQKASDDMIKLAKAIDTAEDLRAVQKELMWDNCSSCHNRFRAPH